MSIARKTFLRIFTSARAESCSDHTGGTLQTFTTEGANERALISMNQQQVQQLQIDDGHAEQAIGIDSDQPFAIVN